MISLGKTQNTVVDHWPISEPNNPPAHKFILDSGVQIIVPEKLMIEMNLLLTGKVTMIYWPGGKP